MDSVDEDDIMNMSADISITSIDSEQNQCARRSEDLVGNESASEETNPNEPPSSSHQNMETESVQYRFQEPSRISSINSILYETETEYRRLRNGVLPTVWISLYPCLTCSMGIYAICRIALMTALYGGAFAIQFALMSAVIGVPFISLMIVIGQRVGSGLVQMWFICPAVKGIGIILQIGYAIYLSYAALHMDRILPFFIDSLVTNHENYKWLNNTVCDGNTANVDLVANELGVYYENKIMNIEMELQGIGSFFRLFTPNILSWIAMIALALRSLKGALLVSSFFYSFGCLIFFAVILEFYSVWGGSFTTLMDIDWTNDQELILIWFQSIREVFFTWLMLGGIILHVCSHNERNHSLRRFLIALVCWIIIMFGIAVIFGVSLRSGLMHHGASLHPALFDSSMNHSSQISMIYSITNLKMLDSVYQLRESSFANRIIGDVFINKKTGLHSYKVLRAITEFLPALLSADCTHSIPASVVSLFYISFFIMGISQQLTIVACSIDMLVQAHHFHARFAQFYMGFIMVSVETTICVLLSLKVGYPIVETLDEFFSSGWSFSISLALLIFFLLIIQRKQITFSTVIKPLLNNTNGILFKMLRHFALWVLPFQIMLVGLVLFADSSVRCIEGASSGVAVKKIVAGISQYISIAFVILFAITIIYINSKKCGSIKECLMDSFAPQLAVFPRDYPNEGSFSRTISSTRDRVDEPPRYSPPPSYSTATSRQLVTQMQRSQSAEEIRFHQVTSQVLPAVPNTENQRLMTVFSENESSTNHAIFTEGANVMESQV